MAAPMTQAELDVLKCPCGAVDCTELFLKSRCHPKAGSIVTYNQKSKTLTIRCRECEAFTTEILVAKDLVVE